MSPDKQTKIAVAEDQNQGESNTSPDAEETIEETMENSQEKIHVSRKILLWVGIIFLISSLCLPLFLGFSYKNNASAETAEESTLKQKTKLLDQQIQAEESKSAILKENLQKIKDDISSPQKRILWSNVIIELEKITSELVAESSNQTIVTYNNYSLSTDGNISLTGTTNSYPAIADLMETIEASTLFKNVKFTSTSKSTDQSGEDVASLKLSFDLDNSTQPSPDMVQTTEPSITTVTNEPTTPQ